MDRRNIYSVAKVNRHIKNLFVRDFVLNKIYIKGEISNYKKHSGGTLYFSLKDEEASISCVMFSQDARRMTLSLKEGDKIVAFGSVSVFEKAGQYQLYVQDIELSGQGALYEEYLRLKEELKEMGMFDPSYKKQIPKYAQRIGIVTSDTGAVIRDIMNIAYRRNPYIQLILYPALVQGEGAIQSICQGIYTLDQMGMDLLIVGRGGGSIEDLWAFNSQEVARAIFSCQTPVISAVGHDTDWTIADEVADLRASTPSEAAERGVTDIYEMIRGMERMTLSLKENILQRIKDKGTQLEVLRYKLDAKSPHQRIFSLRQQLAYLGTQLESKQERIIQEKQKRIEGLRLQLLKCAPEYKLLERKNQLVRLKDRLILKWDMCLQERKQRLEQLQMYLEARSPQKRLKSGYSYVTKADGKVVRAIGDIQLEDEIYLYMLDGKVKAVVEEIHGR